MALDVRKLDAAAVNAIWGRGGGDARATVREVQVISRDRCGDGLASTADRIHLRLEYEEDSKGCHGPEGGDARGGDGGEDDARPRTVVLKTLLLHTWLRFGLAAILGLAFAARWAERLPLIGTAARRFLFVLVGLYQRYFAHAPDAMYEAEAGFYRHLRGLRALRELEAPRCYGSYFDRRSRHFGILLEDLRLREATFPNASTAVSVAQVRALLDQLALLHAAFWRGGPMDWSQHLAASSAAPGRTADAAGGAGSPDDADLSWLPTRLRGGMFPVFDGIGRELIDYQLSTHGFKARLVGALEARHRGVAAMWDLLWRSQRALHQRRGAHTVLHGDAHVGNTYLLPGRGGLLDFQLLARGHHMNDVTYLIVTALEPAARRAEERGLIAHYIACLARHGVRRELLPTLDESLQAHRLAAIWGLVIGWLITPPVNYGEVVTAANIRRLVAACVDLRSFQVAEELPPPEAEAADAAEAAVCKWD